MVGAGIRTPQDIAALSPKDLSDKIEHLYHAQAGKIIKAAKVCVHGWGGCGLCERVRSMIIFEYDPEMP